MKRTHAHRIAGCLPVVLALLLQIACSAGQQEWDEELSPTPRPTRSPVPTATPPRRGSTIDKWDLWTGGTLLRGANIWQRVVVPDLDGPTFLGSRHVGPPYVQDDFDALAALGANVVNISGPGLFTEQPPYVLDEQVQANLDRLLDMIARADMFAVITFRTGPGRSDFTFYRDGAGDWFDRDLLIESVWEDLDAQEAWIAMWRATAERYRDNPIVVGYDLMCEPNSAGALLGIWEPQEFYDAYAGTLYDWNQLYPRISGAIREVDGETPILIGGNGWSAVRWLPYLQPTGDERTVYTAHQYEPQDQYTHQEPPARNAYPGLFDLDWDDEPDVFGLPWLDELLFPVDAFQEQHDVPVAVNEFGVARWVPGAAEYMADLIDLFERRGMNHMLWVWDPTWAPWSEDVNTFNFRFGPDPDSDDLDPDNDLQAAIVASWEHNAIRPSTILRTIPSGSPLDAVTHWLYLIGVDLEQETVDRIADSTYDLVVLDFVPSEEENEDYPMAEVVAQLQNAAHPKQVIAYVDIAEAESYRTYWQPGWRVGNPDWIVGDDPDGWEENYPVAYWYDAWQEIWLGEEGTLQQILDAGFDGVYLDWIEAYSDENVIQAAEEDDVDPLQEMIWWVGDISTFVKSRCSNCVVIAQNAAELAGYDAYVETIDAIAQEQIWFDGGADNDPPGDCPLPRTEEDVDSAAYRDSLSGDCQRQYDEFPDSTLHTSSQEYLDYLAVAQRKGLPIFTVDYALEPENVAWVYQTARALGFVPFVGGRELDRYLDPVP